VKAWDSLDDFYVALDQVRFEGGSEYSRLTIDWLEQVSSEDIVKLYQDYLIPANGYVVSIVGQFDEQKVIDDIRRYLGAIPKGQPYELSNVRSYQEPSTTIIERTGAEPEQSLVSYGYVSPKSDRVSFTQQAADSIAIAIAQERLEMEMRETKGWVYGVEEYFSVAYGRVAETTIDFEMYTSPVHTDDLISHTESVINELLSQGITNDEYERHLESYLTHVQYSIDDDYTMSFLYADSYVKGLDIVDMINYPITLSNVTKSMIEDRMLTLFDPAGLTIGVLTE
jgi:predicted Zn-dependent peptidase